DDEVMSPLTVSQEVIFLADPVDFAFVALGQDVNFPEHRAPSWLESGKNPVGASRRLPKLGDIVPGELQENSGRPGSHRGYVRRWLSTVPDRRPRYVSYLEIRWQSARLIPEARCLPEHRPTDVANG